MELGKKIKALRWKAGLTQEQLAEKCGIGAQSVSKWENGSSMPDITALPLLAEIFGVTIDDHFDLTAEQRLNRIENRLDAEDDLPQDVFLEYEEFLKNQAADPKNKKRATELSAYLYWHRMESFAKKARKTAKEAIRLAPGEKGCQWILQKADGHAAWDWNIQNHSAAIEFYQELADENPNEAEPLYYLLDQLIADHRAEEAEKALGRLERMIKGDRILEVYRAHIALARFDEKKADGIIEALLQAHPENDGVLFEAAQYFAKKADYDRAIPLYEASFEKDPRRPRFQDALMAICDIHQIRKEYRKAADDCGRILDLLQNEWGIRESDDIRGWEEKKASLLAKAN